MLKCSVFSVFGLLIVLSSPLDASSRWIIAEDEDLTVLSNSGEWKTQSAFEAIIRFEMAIEMISDGRLRLSERPLKVIVCRDGKSLRAIMPENERDRERKSIFHRGQDYDLMILRSRSDSKTLVSTIYNELARRIIDDLGDVPLWLIEGFSEMCERFKIGKTKLTFGFDYDTNSLYSERYKLMPLARLFLVGSESDQIDDQELKDSFYLTSSAFVQVCLFSNEGRFRKSLAEFVEDLKKQDVSENLFKEHFGMSYRDMDSKLRIYVDQGLGQRNAIYLDQELNMPEIRFEEATEASVNLYLGSALIQAERLQDARSCLEESQNMIGPLDELGSMEVRELHADLNVEFVRLELLTGNYEQAVEYATRAVDLGTEAPSALIVHAESTMGLKHEVSPVGQLSLEQLNTVIAALVKVFSYDLRNQRAHEIHAVAWSHCDEMPKDTHTNGLLFACKLFPTNEEINFNAAKTFQRIGRSEDAKKILSNFIDQTQDESSKEEATELLLEIKSD